MVHSIRPTDEGRKLFGSFFLDLIIRLRAMKQFNLLIVSKDPRANDEIFKTASRVLRKSYVLQVQNLEEAYPLLKRLNINLLLIDMDGEKINFTGLNQSFPGLTTIGMTDRLSAQTIPPDPSRNRILGKNDFRASLTAELKAIRKDKGYASAQKATRTPVKSAGSTDFKNFFRLVPTPTR